MTKYYKLYLNCARVHDMSPFSNDCGFIKVLPIRGSEVKKGVFGSRMVGTIEYAGKYYVMAKLENDHFVDTVLGKEIYYDPSGLQDITIASINELEQNLYVGLTCFGFRRIEEEVALYYTNKVISDEVALDKYTHELEEIERKQNVVDELARRREVKPVEVVNTNKSKIKLKKLIRSA